MKKLLCVLAFVGAGELAQGQGSVNFSAGLPAYRKISTNSVVGGPATGLTAPAAAASYHYTLFVADSTVTSLGSGPTSLDPTLTSGWSQVIWASGNRAGMTGAVYGTNTLTGRFNGNASTDGVIVAGRANGSSASFVVLGWSSDVAGADWSVAKDWIDALIINGLAPSDGWYGRSDVATSVQLGGGLNPQGTLFGTAPGQVSGFTLERQPVGTAGAPEPNAAALVGLGAIVLVGMRRHKPSPGLR